MRARFTADGAYAGSTNTLFCTSYRTPLNCSAHILTSENCTQAAQLPQPICIVNVSVRLVTASRCKQARRCSHACCCTPAGDMYSSWRTLPPGEMCWNLCWRRPCVGVTHTVSCSCPGRCPAAGSDDGGGLADMASGLGGCHRTAAEGGGAAAFFAARRALSLAQRHSRKLA